MTTEEIPDDPISSKQKILERHVAMLMEHFDTVHIFVSKFETNGDTFDASIGDGNILARKCQCREWMLITDERLKQTIRRSSDE